MPHIDVHIAITFGLLLLCSLLAGMAAETFRLPKVTAYLLVGMLIGPQVLHLVPEHQVHALDPMVKLAMGLVLFNLGSHFSLGLIRKIAWRVLPLSLGELSATFLLVTAGLLLVQLSASQAVLLGCLALATAPATTVLVLKEFKSEGPLTEYTGVLVVLNNLASILTFEIAFLTIGILQQRLDTPLYQPLIFLTRDLLGSILLGAFTGFVLSYALGLMHQSRWLVLLVAATTLVLGICETLDYPYMLAFLTMGMVVANTSPLAQRVVEELDHTTGLLCVLFFAVHGAELELGAFVDLGLVGAVYIACRLLGKYLGINVAARLAHEPPEVRDWLGTTLMAQAGAAIALSTIAVHRDPVLGAPLQTIILGTVVFFEVVGPLLIRLSVIRAGEVPLAQAIHHQSRTLTTQFRDIWHRTLALFNVRPSKTVDMASDTVAKIMRRSVRGIEQSASFEEVIEHIEDSVDNTFPVVDRQSRVIGVIRYPLLSNVMFDKSVNQLVRAEDLATSAATVLYPDETLARARDVFRRETDDVIPVVDRHAPHALLGVVRRSDMMYLLIRQHRSSS